jgi:hypothetical protein
MPGLRRTGLHMFTLQRQLCFPVVVRENHYFRENMPLMTGSHFFNCLKLSETSESAETVQFV